MATESRVGGEEPALSVSAAAAAGGALVLCLVLCVQLAKKNWCDDDDDSDSVCHYLCTYVGVCPPPHSASSCLAIISEIAKRRAPLQLLYLSLNLPGCGRVPQADRRIIMPSII